MAGASVHGTVRGVSTDRTLAIVQKRCLQAGTLYRARICDPADMGMHDMLAAPGDAVRRAAVGTTTMLGTNPRHRRRRVVIIHRALSQSVGFHALCDTCSSGL
jgi:hypothetical protein